MAESEENVTLGAPGKPSPAPEDRPNHDQYELNHFQFKLFHGRMMDITCLKNISLDSLEISIVKYFGIIKKNAIKIVLEEICLDYFCQLQGTELITVQLI